MTVSPPTSSEGDPPGGRPSQPGPSSKKARRKSTDGEGETETMVDKVSMEEEYEGEQAVSHSQRPLFETTIGMKMARKVISYKDVCIGVNGGAVSDEEEFIRKDDGPSDAEEEGPVNHEVEDILCPEVIIEPEVRMHACEQWRQPVIVKVLGKRLSLRFMQTRLEKMWQPKGRMEVIDLENDYFLARVQEWDDVHHVFNAGPWNIADHYVMVQQWRPGFFPSRMSLNGSRCGYESRVYRSNSMIGIS